MPHALYRLFWGGTKVDDSIAVAHHMLKHHIADQVIVIGVVGKYFSPGRWDIDIGRPSAQLIQQLRYEKEIGKAGSFSRIGERIVVPEVDCGEAREGGTKRISGECYPFRCTSCLTSGWIRCSPFRRDPRVRNRVSNGPAGVFEDR